MLTKLLTRHLKEDGTTFEGEDDLKEAMAAIYLGTFNYLICKARC